MEGCIGLVRNTPTKCQDGVDLRSTRITLRNTICESVSLTISFMFRSSRWAIYHVAVSVGDIVSSTGPESHTFSVPPFQLQLFAGIFRFSICCSAVIEDPCVLAN